MKYNSVALFTPKPEFCRGSNAFLSTFEVDFAKILNYDPWTV